jgi:hypothetical protein
MISYRSSLKGAGNGSGDSGHTITDGTTIYTQRPVLQFDSPLTVQDDSENEATKVGVETGAVVDFSEFELPSSSGNQSGQNNNSLQQYSTDEIVIGTWTDGKPIYRKVLTGTTLSNGSNSAYIPIGTTIDSLVRLDEYMYANQSDWCYIHIIPSDVTSCGISYDRQYVLAYVNSSLSSGFNQPLKIIIEYTKASDVAPT